MSKCLLAGCPNDATGAITVLAPATGLEQHAEHVRIPVCPGHLRFSNSTITSLALGQPPEILVVRMDSIIVGDSIPIGDVFMAVTEVRTSSLILNDYTEYSPPMGHMSFVPRKRRPGE